VFKVSVGGGKYTVIVPETPADYEEGIHLSALRYGESWRDMTGDNLVQCLAAELHEARQELAKLNQPREPVTPIPGSGTY